MHKSLILLALLAPIAVATYALPSAAEQGQGCVAPASSGKLMAEDGTLPSVQADGSATVIGGAKGCRLAIVAPRDDDNEGLDGEDGE